MICVNCKKLPIISFNHENKDIRSLSKKAMKIYTRNSKRYYCSNYKNRICNYIDCKSLEGNSFGGERCMSLLSSEKDDIFDISMYSMSCNNNYTFES